MLVGLNGLDGLLRVSSRNSSDNHGLKTGVLEHLIVVTVDLDALEVGGGPLNFLLDRSEGSNKLGARTSVVEVESVTSAHATETGDGDLEFGRGHYGFCWVGCKRASVG